MEGAVMKICVMDLYVIMVSAIKDIWRTYLAMEVLGTHMEGKVSVVSS